MPLAWAHAEFIKLVISRHLRYPVDRPAAAWQRYRGQRRRAKRALWFPHAPIGSFPAGSRLIVVLPRPAIIHWGHDGWQATADVATVPAGLGLHAADLRVNGRCRPASG